MNTSNKNCIVVYGHVATGKSEFCMGINQLLPDFRIITINQALEQQRKKYPKLSKKRIKEFAECEFQKSLLDNENIIIETHFHRNIWLKTKEILTMYERVFYIKLLAGYDHLFERFYSQKRTGLYVPEAPFKNKSFLVIWSILGKRMHSIQPNIIIDAEESQRQMINQFNDIFMGKMI